MTFNSLRMGLHHIYLQVLMRALRDFNLPKIVTDDVTIIMGLIGDLFPALDVPRKRDMDFEECVKKSVLVIVVISHNREIVF